MIGNLFPNRALNASLFRLCSLLCLIYIFFLVVVVYVFIIYFFSAKYMYVGQ